jgi:ABC-type Fe3+/spermidine/putrescine transport system ATPase subunit
MAASAIEIRGVSLSLGEFAVHDARVSVGEGEYFVLLGPTGAGKTVLLECVAGLHRPERGEVYVSGEVVNDVAPERRGLGYLPQDYALFPHLSVARNIGFGMRLRRRPRREVERKVRELAELLRITHLLHRSPMKLSGGEQQRVALARALAIEPNVLLLDEPLSALDEQTREGLCGELRRVHEELGTTTMHVSHNFEETLAVADKIGVIHQGRIRQVGTPEEVFRHPNSEFVARFVRCDNVLAGTARRAEGGLRVQVEALDFEAEEGPEGEVFLTVRPEEVELVRPGGGNGPNRVAGRIVGVVDKGALMKVEVGDEGSVGLMALVGRRAFQESGMVVGDEVEAFFASSSAHVFARE